MSEPHVLEQDLFERLEDLETEYKGRVGDVLLVCQDMQGSPREQTTLRMASPMLYAQWEGCAKAVFEAYIDFLQELALDGTAVEKHLLALSWDSHFRRFQHGRNRRVELEIVESALLLPSSKLCLFASEDEKENALDTKSNLNSKNLRALCRKFNVPDSTLESHRIELDAFVNFRNSVAHGGWPTRETQDDISDRGRLVITLAELLADAIREAAIHKTYLRCA